VHATSFWKSHNPQDYSSLPEFLTPAETDELIDNRTPLGIVAVRPGTLQSGPVNFVDVLVDGEKRTKTFSTGAVPGRDALLVDMMAYLEDGGDPIPVTFVRWGKAIGIEGRDPLEPANPPEPHSGRIGRTPRPSDDVPPPSDADAPPESWGEVVAG
jgi:hypothetical protein